MNSWGLKPQNPMSKNLKEKQKIVVILNKTFILFRIWSPLCRPTRWAFKREISFFVSNQEKQCLYLPCVGFFERLSIEHIGKDEIIVIFVWRGFTVSTSSLCCWPLSISYLSRSYSLSPFKASLTQLTRLWVATLSYQVTVPSSWWLDEVAHSVVSVQPTIYRFSFEEYYLPAKLRFLFHALRLYSLS